MGMDGHLGPTYLLLTLIVDEGRRWYMVLVCRKGVDTLMR